MDNQAHQAENGSAMGQRLSLHALRHAHCDDIWFLDNWNMGLLDLSRFSRDKDMSRTLRSPRHRALCEYLARSRKAASLTQEQVAKSLGRHQSFVATVESGQRRIDVVEFLDFAGAIGFDPRVAIKHLMLLRSR
jgi:hypothetical protein